MEEHSYTYQMKPLVAQGLLFLVFYPVIVGLIYKLTTFSALEFQVLTGIYIVTAVGIIALWVFAKSKRIYINQDQIVISTLFGQRVLASADIRRIVFYWSPKGQEIVHIRSRQHSIYLNDLYFPFPELMSDLEMFIGENSVRSNLSAHTENAG